MPKLNWLIISAWLCGLSPVGEGALRFLWWHETFFFFLQITQGQCSLHTCWHPSLIWLKQLLHYAHASLMSEATAVSFSSQTELLQIPEMSYASLHFRPFHPDISSVWNIFCSKLKSSVAYFKKHYLTINESSISLLCAHVTHCMYLYCSTYHIVLIICWERNR